MRGLPFPQDAAFNREQSHEFGTPGPASTSGLGDNISLDPALAAHPAAPLFIPNGVGPSPSPIDIGPLSPSLAIQRYAQGPQGDPFAPQPPPYGYPNPNAIPNSNVSIKPVKRKRRPRREEECGFCSGNDKRNKDDYKELMVTCDECGRSGHPSCMQLGDIGEVLRSYPWKCTECKICEICHEKGDDERILFCDNCDRGWHMDCLDPPVQEAPEGLWFCPLCPSSSMRHSESAPPQELDPEPELEPPIDPALQMDIDPVLREMSVASSSHHTLPLDPPPPPKSRTAVRGKRDRKGKARAVVSEEENEGAVEDGDVEVDIDANEDEGENVEIMPQTASTPRRKSVNNRKRGKGRPRRQSETVPDDGESPGPPLRPQKRIRLIQHSPTPQPSPPRPRKTVRLRLSNQKGKGRARDDDEEEETRKGLFDDILAVDDRDTMKTSIFNGDKDRFERARQQAESKLASQSTGDVNSRSKSPGPSTITGRFPLRSVIHQLQRIQTQSQIPTSHPDSPSPSTPGPSYKFDPNVLRIRSIRFGPYDIQTWYDAPFPEEFSNIPDGRLWICEFCLKYMKSRFGAQRHRLKCKCRHPPGDEIYRDGSISIFEVDGRRNKIYCQNLCLLSKMFLDHKSLFYDVEPFLFYVMTEVDDIGARFVGYFSKEKRSPKDLNLSCIMTLPVRQRQGWGNLLIDFSYLLSKKEQKSGTPERPLSALGAIGYKKYWTLALMRYLQNAPCNPRLEDISTATAMSIEDIYNTLSHLNMITVHESRSSPIRPSPGRSVKFSRSRKVGIARRNLQKTQPKDDDKASKATFMPPTDYDVHWDKELVDNFLAEWESKGYLTLKPDRLKWTPFLISRAEAAFQPYVEDGAVIVAEAETSLASGAAAVFANQESLIDVDVFADSAQQVASPLPDADTHSEDKITKSARDLKIPDLSASKQSSAEPEHHDEPSSPTPSLPSPPPSRAPPPPPPPPLLPPKPRSSTNGLEALAAVALAVSKANPGALRRKSSSTTASPITERITKFGHPMLNGDTESYVPSTTLINSLKLSISTQSPVARDAAGANKGQTENEEPHMKVETPTPLEFTSNGHSRILGDLYPVSSNRTSSVSAQESRGRDDVDEVSVIEKDVELAAQMAREDPGRQRSLRSQHTPPITMVNTKDIHQKDSMRKRRKGVPSPSSDTSPLTPLTPDRPTTRAQAHAQAIETARSNRLTRSQATRLTTNGVSLPNGDSQSASSLRASTRLNGTSPSKSSALTPTPARSQRGRFSSRNGDRREAETWNGLGDSSTTFEDGQAEEDADAEGESDIDADGEPDVPSGDDLRFDETNGVFDTINEQMLNGFSPSNQSEETQTRKSLSGSIRTVHPDSPTLSSLSFSAEPSNNVSPTNPPPVSSLTHSDEIGMGMNGLPDSGMDVEDEEDIDAEGEPDDEDAEGELDTEMY